MNLKKCLILIVILAGFVGNAFAQEFQIRDFSCIVTGNLSKNRVEQLKSIRDNKKYKDYVNKEAINKIIGEDKSSSKTKGSPELNNEGYIFVEPKTGTNYVITSRDILLYCDSWEIQCSKPGSDETVTYSNLKLKAVFDDLDFGILEITDKPFKNGPSINTKTLKDGDDVFIGQYTVSDKNKYNWNVKKGFVSNSNCKVENRNYKAFTIDTYKGPVIRGSVIFVQDSSSITGYALAGFYNYKLSNDTPNLIIHIDEFLKKLTPSNKTDSVDIVKNRTAQLIESLEHDKNEELNYLLSTKWLDSYTMDNYVAYLKSLSGGEYRYRSAFYDMPYEGFRKTFFAQITGKYRNNLKNLELEKVESIDENHILSAMKDADGNNILKASWILEQGDWRLESLSLTPESKLYSLELEFPEVLEKGEKHPIFGNAPDFYGFGINVPFNYKVYDENKSLLSDCKLVPGGFFFFEFYDFLYDTLGVGLSGRTLATDEDTFRTLNLDLCFRLPFHFNSVYVIPKAKGGLMWNFFTDSYGWGVYYETGMDLFFNESWGFGGSFKQQFIYPLVKSTCEYNTMGASVYLLFRTDL